MKHYVIIGNCAAGVNAAESIRLEDEKANITIISDESYPVYSRPVIAYYLAGDVSLDKVWYRGKDFYEKNGIETLFGKRVEKVNPQEKKVALDDGSEISYHKLLVASGASPVYPDISGINLFGVFGFRTLDDVQNLLEMVEQGAQNVVLIGGGLVSSRAGYALAKRGLKINVVVASPCILSQVIDAEGAHLLQEVLREHDWNILTGRNVERIEGRRRVEKVVLDDGSELPADIVIVGKGVRPNVSFLDGTVKVNRGIVVDEKLKAAPDIFAAGDVAETFDLAWETYRVNALWPNAIKQGKIAGHNMVEEELIYEGSLGMNAVDFYGLPLISAGITRPPDESFEVLIRRDEKERVYKKLVLKNGVLKGYILIGDIDRAGILTGFIKDKQQVEEFKEALLDEEISLLVLPPEVRDKNIKEGVQA